MKCEECHERNAEIVLTSVVDDDSVVVHVCRACAERRGLDIQALSEERSEAFMQQDAPGTDEEPEETELRCPSCGLTYAKFKERYRLGCADCYEAFRDRLTKLMRKVQGAQEHTGKRFVAADADNLDETQKPASWTVDLLKRRLAAAIEREEFEEAARLRDQIEDFRKAHAEELNPS